MTTIDAIAAAVGMTKRTVYTRYPDKNALFGAAVQRAIERWIIPAEVLDALDPDDLEGTLTAVAGLRMRNANSADGLRLQHILSAESYRFPEIFTPAYDPGTVPTLARRSVVSGKGGSVRVDIGGARVIKKKKK